jgi:peptidoglycan/LPS O-acetylase OafA/YrhL
MHLRSDAIVITTATHDGERTLQYRAHLDGLRAIAVFLVVAFHAGITKLNGGFVGVDVFFVLSGYLVTQLLVADMTRHGRIQISRFYSRRFRRLLPAAFVTLVVTAAVMSALDPVGALQARNAFKAAFLYSTNWYFIHQSASYFSADVAQSPVLHFWSLAVEEQFYLVWPVLLGALAWLAASRPRRSHRTMQIAIALAAAASLLWAMRLRTTDFNHAYYGTDARAYQLLAGALLAITPGVVRRAARRPRVTSAAACVSLVALVVVSMSWLHIDAIERGVVVTAIVLVVLVAIEASEGGIAQRSLSTAPMVYLGLISYGIYLWHWPVVLVMRHFADVGSVRSAAIVAFVSAGLASLSYQLLERPVRLSPVLGGHRRAVIAIGLAVSVIGAFVLIPSIVDPTSNPPASASTSAKGTPIPASVDWRRTLKELFGNTVSCVGRPANACTIVHGTGSRVMLMGDSNAEMMIPAFRRVAEREHLTLALAVTAGCPWQRDFYRFPPVFAHCREAKEDAYRRVVPTFRPDLLVLVNSREEFDHRPGDPRTADDRRLQQVTATSLRQLSRDARNILIVEPIPQAPSGMNPLACLSKAKILEQCRYVVKGNSPTWMESYERELAAQSPRIETADFDRLVCPWLPICDPVVDGIIVKWDGLHLSKRYAEHLAGPITAYLQEHRLLPRSPAR